MRPGCDTRIKWQTREWPNEAIHINVLQSVYFTCSASLSYAAPVGA